MPRLLKNLDMDLLRSFVMIAENGSFTRAAKALHLQQSTISLQMKRLEGTVGSRLLQRSPQLVVLTPEGEVLLDYARKLLDLNDEVIAKVQEPRMKGVVRLGSPEDFATLHLPASLARFAHAYPDVSLEVTCDLTLLLLDKFRRGLLDIVLIKRESLGFANATRVWREPLVWVAGKIDVRSAAVLPLAVSPKPCVYRKTAIDSLTRAKRPWRVSYTCGSLAGTLAAVRAKLGVTVLPKAMVPDDLQIFDGVHLPELKDTEIALMEQKRLSLPAQKLRDFVIRSLS